jgi:putative ABC transport system permease protein
MRLAIRSLFRSPAYAATSIGTIALTIALAATVFAIVDGVLFKPLPYREPETLFSIHGVSADPGSQPVARLDLEYLREADATVEVTAFADGQSLIHRDRADMPVWSARIPSNFFDVLGQQPFVGGFTVDDFVEGGAGMTPRRVLVSYAFWQQRMGSDPSALGRVIELVDRRFTVAGVLPRDFVFPSYDGRRRPDILLPLPLPREVAPNRWTRYLSVIVRVPETMPRDVAHAKLNAAIASRVSEYGPRPAEGEGPQAPLAGVSMQALGDRLGGNERRFFTAAFAGAALLIGLGAINVAGLFAARARDRGRELSVRAALGAGRGNLMAVLLSEAGIIAAAGGAIGVAIAAPALNAVLSLLPETLLLLKAPTIDWRVVVFAFVAAIVPVVLFALLPAAAAMREAPAHRLAGGATTTPRRRVWGRNALLITESAISIVLLLAGSLILASFTVLRGQDAGFDPDRLAVIDARFVGPMAPEEREIVYLRAVDRIRQVPGVRDVATINASLLDTLIMPSAFILPAGGRARASDIAVSSTFFEVAGLKLLEGRYMTPDEIVTRRPVVVVSEETARAHWPGRSAVGQFLEAKDVGQVSVVGVVEEATFSNQAEDPAVGEIYLPRGLSRRYQFLETYLVKTAVAPDVIAGDIALALRRDVPQVLVRRAESFDNALARSVRLHTFRAVIFTVAGAAGGLLLVVGIGGIVATGVARRLREIGIRAALGAPQRRLTGMIVQEHVRPVILGAMGGLLLSWWTTRLVSAFLYEVDAHDPRIWAASACVLVLLAAVAAWIPARRASAVDPVTVLRAD